MTPTASDRAKPAAPRRLSRRGRVLLAIGALLIALLAAEVGVRVLARIADNRREADWTAMQEERIRRTPGMEASLGHVIRPSPYHDVIYQLLPNLDVSYRGGRMRTNSAGFRSPEVALRKPPGVFRILCLGDSVMFGSGLADGEPYVCIAEAALNAAGLAKRVEVINTAVPGYNTGMEVALAEHVGLAYDPDLIWIDFVGNDIDLPNFISQKRDVWALDRSFLLAWADRSLATGSEKDPFQPLTNSRLKGGKFESDPELVPPEYRHLVGPDGYRAAMTKLAKLARQRGIPVLVTASGGIPDYVMDALKSLSLLLVPGAAKVGEWMKENGADSYRDPRLIVSQENPHPSALQHRILGEFYAEAIRTTGVVK